MPFGSNRIYSFSSRELADSQASSDRHESTQKLFKAIDDENLEDFKQALAEGAELMCLVQDIHH